jgi:sugar fermentation stimulation protein A
MKYEGELILAKLKERPNRFLGLIELDGKITHCFIPNPGRMKELMIPGTNVYLIEKKGPHRKTDYDMKLVEMDGNLISVDSRLPNKIFAEALIQNKLEPFRGYSITKTEPSFMDSRLDFLLKKRGEQALVECKSCNLVEDRTALFPDAPTLRGARHINTLTMALEQGRAGVVFIVQRDDADIFSPFKERDPEFAGAIKKAIEKGVETYAYTCNVDLQEIYIKDSIPVVM